MSRGNLGISLALLLVILMATVAWLGVRALGQANRQDAAWREVTEAVRRIERDDFARAQNAVGGLAQHPVIVAHAKEGGDATPTVDAVLLQARLTSAAAIVMVLDPKGKVISCASTGASLVGNNYAFRPYFSEAMRGNRVVYGAIGVTTHRRGFYFSAPIGPPTMPSGVVVTKVELDEIDRALSNLDSPAILVSPDHVVFAANRPDWLLHAARPLNQALRQRLLQSQQFAGKPIDDLPFDTRLETVEFGNAKYSTVEVPLAVPTGFKIILLDPVRDFPLTPPQRRFVVGSALSVTMLAGLVVALLIVNARRTHAEKRLRRTELHLEVTLDSLTDAVITTDSDGNVTRMNPAAVVMTGCSNHHAVGRPLVDLLRRAMPDIQELAPIDPYSEMSPSVESRISLAKGEERHIVHRITRLRGASTESAGTVFVGRDVTEENQLREQLQQAQKMEAIGRLAGGVAHDFNNLLSIILGNAELMDRKLAQHPMQKFAREIVGAAARAGDLTRQLLAFSRKSSIKSAPVDLHVVLDEAISLFNRGTDTGILLEQRRQAVASHVLGDSTQLQGAFLNLLINARDAMPRGGALIVSTCNVATRVSSESHVDVHSGIEILIEDEGDGIPEALRDRIFEPFFTTKAEGRGTGLGLAAVYGCVQSHRGRIDVESRDGPGTRFRIQLPIIEPPDPKRADLETRGSGPTGQVLVVDSASPLRRLTERALRELGQDVTCVESIDDAVSYLQRSHVSVMLVVFDTGFDTLRAVENVRRIRAASADLPILVTSPTISESDALGHIGAQVRVLARPYRVQELGMAIDELFASSSRSQTIPKD